MSQSPGCLCFDMFQRSTKIKIQIKQNHEKGKTELLSLVLKVQDLTQFPTSYKDVCEEGKRKN